MANIKFYIDENKVNGQGFAPVKANIAVESKNHWKVIAKVPLKLWTVNNALDLWEIPNRRLKVLPKKKDPEKYSEKIDKLIRDYTRKAEDFFDYCTVNRLKITSEMVIEFYAGKLSDKKLQKATFNEAFQEFIDIEKPSKAYNTTRNRQTILNFLKDFQTETGKKITFESIDLKLFDALKAYCFETKQVKTNYLAKIVAVLKTFLSWATDREYYTGKLHTRFKAPEKDVDVIFLAVDEFKALYNHHFENKKLARVRDVFCFGCLTGLRFSDLMQLKRDHIQNGHIVKSIQKTKEPVKIPILAMAQTIIERYEHPINLLPRISNQKFNDYIKKCCEAAKINQPTIETSFSGNAKTEVSRPKHELVTAHTARKTFVTLSFFLGMDVKTIKSITGHTQDKTFDKYLKIADEMKKTKMEEAWNKI